MLIQQNNFEKVYHLNFRFLQGRILLRQDCFVTNKRLADVKEFERRDVSQGESVESVSMKGREGIW